MNQYRLRAAKPFWPWRKDTVVVQVAEVREAGHYYSSDDPLNVPPPGWDPQETYTFWRDLSPSEALNVKIKVSGGEDAAV